jgi:regulator of ribosome biosynthesis
MVVQGVPAESLELDLGNLTALDPSPTDASAFRAGDISAAVLAAATAVAQTLVGEIFKLPVTLDTNVGPLARLPPPTAPVPREKPLPKAKPETKWQKFAAEKGIAKRAKSKLVWDESSNEWKRRHGYDRVNDDSDTIIVNAKQGDGPDSDPFAEAKKAKQDRVAKNKKQQLKNMQNGGLVAPSLALTSALPFEGSRSGQQGKVVAKHHKAEVKAVKDIATLSTASLGKFDKKLDGEKPGRPAGKQRTRLPVTDSSKERSLVDSTIKKVLSQEQQGILNTEKAVRTFINTEQVERSKRKLKTPAKERGTGKKSAKRK